MGCRTKDEGAHNSRNVFDCRDLSTLRHKLGIDIGLREIGKPVSLHCMYT